jgi:L-lactate dehydrogenase
MSAVGITGTAPLKELLPAEPVIGTGTMLDTARLRRIIGRELDLDPRFAHAQVVAEHGDSEVTMRSSACVGGALLDQREREALARSAVILRDAIASAG